MNRFSLIQTRPRKFKPWMLIVALVAAAITVERRTRRG